jgi:hypothetical protein
LPHLQKKSCMYQNYFGSTWYVKKNYIDHENPRTNPP